MIGITIKLNFGMCVVGYTMSFFSILYVIPITKYIKKWQCIKRQFIKPQFRDVELFSTSDYLGVCGACE
jgi:hypothetical protein